LPAEALIPWTAALRPRLAATARIAPPIAAPAIAPAEPHWNVLSLPDSLAGVGFEGWLSALLAAVLRVRGFALLVLWVRVAMVSLL
jgi:hypothetical protein